MPSPTVCIIIAAKDAEGTIAKAIGSALCQNSVSEVIVVDDGSSDKTADVALDCGRGDARLKVIGLPRNVGPSAARNVALELTAADFVCVLDSDDFMLPGRIEKMLAQTDLCDIVGDDLLFRSSEHDEIQRRDLLELNDGETRFLSFRDFIEGNIPRPGHVRRELGFLKPLIARDFLMKTGLRYRQEMRLGEDYALYAEALLKGARFKLMKEAGYVSVERSDSLSARHTISDLQAILAFQDEVLQGDLAADDRRALRRHRMDTFCRLEWRLLIQAKAQQRYFDAFGHFLSHPKSTVYIGREIAKTAAFRLRSRIASC